MSQTTVTDEPQTFFEGLCAVKEFAHSRIASGQILVGKAAGAANGDLSPHGSPAGTGAQECQALDASNPNFVGVSMYDAQKEIPDGATYNAYADSDTVPLLRRGQIWVFVEAAITSLALPVWARNAAAGALPDAALGTFAIADGGNHVDLSAHCRWLAAGAIGARNFGLLEVRLS